MARVLNLLKEVLKASKTDINIIIRNYKISYGDKVTELGENTLTGRLLMYLNNFNIADINVKQLANGSKPVCLGTLDLRQYDFEQIQASIKSLDIGQSLSQLSFLKAIDAECARRINQMKTDEILEIMYDFMWLMPNRITVFKFYKCAVKELSRRMEYLKKHELISLIFYIGLEKKFTKHRDLVRKCLEFLSDSHFDSLTAEDFCVICNSTFKTTTRIKGEAFLSEIIRHLHNNLQLFKDPALFITLLKTIRQNKYQDEDLLGTLSCTIFFNNTIEYYSFSALCHILAVYSDYLYYDENILRVFTERCVSLLKDNKFISKNEHLLTHARLKDIKRLLWCLSNLNYNGLETSDIKNVIIPNIIERVEAGDVEDNFSSLIEITLYLWMLNYRAYELLPHFLNSRNIQAINNSNGPIKQRLNLLLTCIFYEEKELLKNINHYPKLQSDYKMPHQLEKRPLLQKVMNNLKEISKKQELNKFEMTCQVPGINIIGITGYRKNIYKTAQIEILDEYTTLKNTQHVPTGMMQLKIRLLENSEEALILIHSDEIGSMDNKEIQQVLSEEIEFVC